MRMNVPCPFCQASDPKPVNFSWWGGILGPKLLSHVRCMQCGKTYNGKSGKSNDTAIAIYLAISLVILVVIFGMMAMTGFLQAFR
jgi:uncharacterized protein (DUF983 family)